MFTRMACLFLLFSACVNTQPGNPVAQRTSADVNDAIPVQPDAQTDNSGPYHGTIAGLRQLGAKSGVKVTIDEVAVTGLSGNAKTAYVSDPAGGAYSGILVALCDSKIGTCAAPPSGVGAIYSLTGTFLITTDGLHMSIATPTLTAVAGASPISVPEYVVYPSSLAETETHNADARGVLVSLYLPDGPAQITSITPAGYINNNYTPAMEAACRGTNGPADTTQCCPSVGPKYFGFEVTVNGAVIGVSTANYPSKKNGQIGAALTIWPCDGNFDATLKTSQSFSKLGGLFDVNYGVASLTPASANDFQLTN